MPDFDQAVLPPPDDVTGNWRTANSSDALRRCAAGDLAPDITLAQLLSQLGPERTEAVLGDAIWDALENRENKRAERLAEVQRLWNSRRPKVHGVVASRYR